MQNLALSRIQRKSVILKSSRFCEDINKVEGIVTSDCIFSTSRIFTQRIGFKTMLRFSRYAVTAALLLVNSSAFTGMSIMDIELILFPISTQQTQIYPKEPRTCAMNINE